jgi:penicillin amidase
MKDIQADTLSLPAQQLLPLLTAVKPLNARQQQAIEMLSNWDGDMQQDSQAAALFAVWSRQLRQALFNDELAGEWGKLAEQAFLRGLSGEVTADNVVVTLLTEKQLAVPGWCDNISTSTVESCDTILRQSLDDTLTQLSKLAGDDLDDWQWGELHHTSYDHQPFSNIKLLDQIFARKVSNGGGDNTVNVSGAQFEETIGYRQTFGAGFRQIIAMGHQGATEQPTTHLLMNSTGQSGNVLSEHYDDMVIPFRDLSFVTMDSAGQQPSVLLTPANNTTQSPADSQP